MSEKHWKELFFFFSENMDIHVGTFSEAALAQLRLVTPTAKTTILPEPVCMQAPRACLWFALAAFAP